MANPFPFASGEVLTAANMNSIGAWTSFAPSWNGLTVGDGIQSFYYAQVNEMLTIVGRITFGSTTTVSGAISMNSPVTGTLEDDAIGSAQLRDSGVATRIGVVGTTSNTVTIYYHSVSGSLINLANTSPTAPFTWANGDWIKISITARVS